MVDVALLLPDALLHSHTGGLFRQLHRRPRGSVCICRQDQDGLSRPATTFSLPYLVALKKGWLGDVQVEDVHVTGDANAMRVLLSGNADIALIGTLNVLASIHAGANVRAIHSWQPIGDYAWCSPGERATSLATLPARPSHRLVQAGYRTNCPAW